MTDKILYSDWLESLKPGDKVKTSDCSHRGTCNCDDTVVGAICEMFGEPVITVVNDCKVNHYSQKNGRELGSRKNTYKNGSIVPFTEDDQRRIDAQKQVELEQKDKAYLARELSKFLCNSLSFEYDLRMKVSKNKMTDVLEAFSIPYELPSQNQSEADH